MPSREELTSLPTITHIEGHRAPERRTYLVVHDDAGSQLHVCPPDHALKDMRRGHIIGDSVVLPCDYTRSRQLTLDFEGPAVADGGLRAYISQADKRPPSLAVPNAKGKLDRDARARLMADLSNAS